MMIILVGVGSTQPTSSQHYSKLSMYMPKRVGNKGQPFLTPILQLIYSNQPLMILNSAIEFSYNLVTTTFNSRRTSISSNLFQRFVGNNVKSFFEVHKAKKEVDFTMRHFFVMILRVTRWSTIE